MRGSRERGTWERPGDEQSMGPKIMMSAEDPNGDLGRLKQVC